MIDAAGSKREELHTTCLSRACGEMMRILRRRATPRRVEAACQCLAHVCPRPRPRTVFAQLART